jgi:hypothetical protein
LTGKLTLRRYGFEDRKETSQGWLYTIARTQLDEQAKKHGYPIPDSHSAKVEHPDLTKKGSVNSP